MKKLLFLILIAFAATAQASWMKMGEIDGGTFYIDTAIILSARVPLFAIKKPFGTLNISVFGQFTNPLNATRPVTFRT